MEITIDRMDEDDLAECSELYISAFKEPPWNENWDCEDAFERLNDFLACPNTIALKATGNGRILGFVMGEIQKWSGTKFYYLKELCVAGEVQRKGVGRSLMENLNQTVKEKGASKIYLITQRNSILSAFYSSLDYVENANMIVAGEPVH